MSFKRVGYGQVEPNQLSAQKTGQIYASLPLDTDVNILQNGEFMYYDYQSGKVSATDSTGVSEPMLVFNEIKLYEPFWRTTYKDFAMIRNGENYVTSKLATQRYDGGAPTAASTAVQEHTEYPYRMDGFAPRLLKTNIGDIYTTNMVKTGVEYKAKDLLTPAVVTAEDGGKTLVLGLVATGENATNISTMRFVVAKVYTMPDGQPGLKLQRIA